MTKQEKIREGMYDVAMGMAGYQKLTPTLITSMVTEQLRFLANRDVVIKEESTIDFDAKLILDKEGKPTLTDLPYKYEAVEPLIEE